MSTITLHHEEHGKFTANVNHPAFSQPIEEVRQHVSDIYEGPVTLTDMEARIISADCTPIKENT